MADLTSPRHIADVEQAVDPFFQLHERAVIGEISDLPFDDCIDRIFLGHASPRILLRLLHAERKLLPFLIDAQNDDLNLVANVDQLARMIHAPRPRHLADVHQAFDPRLQLHECAVAHHVDDRALMRAPDRIFLDDLVPRVVSLLLQAQGDLFLLAVNVQDHHLDFLVNRHHLARMANPLPAHVGDVQEAVDAPQIDERAEVGDVLHHALANLLDLQLLQQRLAILLALSLDERPSADDDIAPRLVDLEHFTLHDAADVIADVRRTANIDLAGRKKHLHAADIDEQSTLDLSLDGAGDGVALLQLADDLVPLNLLVGPALGHAEHAAFVGLGLFVFEILNKHFDELADLRGRLTFVPFVHRHGGFALEADIHHHVAFFDAENPAFDDFVDFEIGDSDRA